MANIRNIRTEPQEQSSDIDINGVLNEYGLDAIPAETVVTQQNGNISTTATAVQSSITEEDAFAIIDDAIVANTDTATPITGVTESDVISSNAFPEEQMMATPTVSESEGDAGVDNVALAPEGNDAHLATQEILSLLPPNPPVFEINANTSRFSGALWYDAIQKCRVILAGLGGIGSYVLYNLSRMQPSEIFVYDDDIVETANLSGQLYSAQMVGAYKVDAMAQLAKDFSKYNGVITIPEKFTETTPGADIMICGFDNMEARKSFFNSWLNHIYKSEHKENCLFIDGRLALEEFQVFCIKGDDTYNIRKYAKEYLFLDDEAEAEQCSMKQTTYCSNMIGSIIVNLFTNFVANTLAPIIERDLPFKTYYSASMIYLKTES